MSNFTTRFSTFEIIRIVVPGAYCVFLTWAFCIGFGIDLLSIIGREFGLLLFILGSITVGLSFYARETPKKRKAFLSNQPSIYILDRSREISAAHPLTEDEARRLYFYILNQHIPPTVHDKIFFFGMIYNIMITIRRTSFWFGLAGIGALIIQIAITHQTTLAAVLVISTIWVIYVLNVRHNKADRKMQENYQDQIFWLEMNRDIVDALITQRTKK